MSHTVRGKIKLLARVRRIRGQVEALERALEAETGCTAVLQQIAAVRGAMNGLMASVIEDHVLPILRARPSRATRFESGALTSSSMSCVPILGRHRNSRWTQTRIRHRTWRSKR